VDAAPDLETLMQFQQLKRRAFITLFFTASIWPLVGHGQTVSKVPRIGVLRVARASPSTAPAYHAFFDELSTQGFKDGDNLIAEMRWVDEDARGPEDVAAELVRLPVDVLVVEGPEAYLKAAIAATATTPIVMSIGNYDPLARGYIKSLARPGGNVTGIFFQRPELAKKQVDLFSQAFPGRTRLGILWDAGSADQFDAAEAAARSLRMEVHGYKFERSPYDLDAAFRAVAESSVQMLLVESSPLFAPYGRRIAELAIEYRLPTMFIVRSYVDRGGLMSYGPDRVAALRLTATYVGKILKGADPADLPVEQPTKYELIVNLKTAQQLELDIPQTVLVRADEVIE
jgi:putative tryptophan/tyrosine transport system substrate-binding protein